MDSLDDLSVIRRFDSGDALKVVGDQAEQLAWQPEFLDQWNDSEQILNVVLAGMGGSALGGSLARDWLNLPVPFEVVRDYDLPAYIGQQTLVILVSVSGNTEETLAALDFAGNHGARICAVAGGGKLWEIAESQNLPRILLPKYQQPRYGVFAHLRAIATILASQNLATGAFDELAAQADFVKDFLKKLAPEVPAIDNPAKQLALDAAGKTPLIFASNQFRAVAYKWKISFNENAKNVAYCNAFPEFDHNELTGWSSHPVEKPFAVFDLRSNFDNDRIQRRFEISDRLLSGLRPAAHNVDLAGDNVLAQMLCGCGLGDFASIYLGILNGVNPAPVELVEKLKSELSK
ncbi:MAG: bifunctional phosphoglucose/phosphomannose isomerase [Candidatus Nomurabacteria bacterium]|jgi:glucose/mannose-6-phosphate isomerase|nr:bifunctional phosphoglucose/phosphomannose isomerase [Candidatus Nomurabacteria bacterium]